MARRRRQQPPEEHTNHERWLVSYADFITLLFAFFVMMYAISSINEGKYRVLSDTLVAAFHTPPKAPRPVQIGEEGRAPAALEQQQRAPAPIQIQPRSAVDTTKMERLANQIEQALNPLIEKGLINVHSNKLWVEVEMNTKILFGSGSAELEDEAFGPLSALAKLIVPVPNYIHVEGYTDNLPISNDIFPSNWELSANRAASVVHLFMRRGVSPERMAAIGYGQYRPIADNGSAEGRRRNRRVVVVILADKNARRMLDIERNGSDTDTSG